MPVRAFVEYMSWVIAGGGETVPFSYGITARRIVENCAKRIEAFGALTKAHP